MIKQKDIDVWIKVLGHKVNEILKHHPTIEQTMFKNNAEYLSALTSTLNELIQLKLNLQKKNRT